MRPLFALILIASLGGCGGLGKVVEAFPVYPSPTPTPPPLPPLPCHEIAVRIRQIRLDLFLDPSDENRRAIARKFLDQHGPALGAQPSGCGALVSAYDDFPELIPVEEKAGRSLQRERMMAVSPPRLTSVDAENAVTLALARCTDRRSPECLRSLSTLLHVPKRAASIFQEICNEPGEKPEITCKIWRAAAVLSLELRETDREEALRRLLLSDDRALIEFGLEEAVGRLDPRAWSPPDVAVAIIAARSWCDQGRYAISENGEDFLSPARESAERCTYFGMRLKRMGYRNWWRLDTRRIRPGATAGEHFDNEGELLGREWFEKQGLPIPRHNILSEAHFSEVIVPYVVMRREEIDAQAPRPDPEAVAREIDRLTKKWRLDW